MANITQRHIALFTGNRAEYGLLSPILQVIADDTRLCYSLIVSGSHLDQNFGATLSEIEHDGFDVAAEIRINHLDDTLSSTTQAIGQTTIDVSRALAKLKPDLFVVYADRFETFGAAIASTQMSIPTAHIEGGDVTDGGALDDSVRHAITKLAHLHFTSNKQASERILKLGEERWRVHMVGFPMIDLIAAGNFASPEEVQKKLRLDLAKPLILFTQHSVTTEFDQAKSQILRSLSALESLANEGVQVIITYPNNDAGGRAMIEEIKTLNDKRMPGIQVHRSLGRALYHGVLNVCGRVGRGACVGNSSSGIKETPAFGVPTVNIGSRQLNRLRSTNVLDTDYDKDAILAACQKALFDVVYRRQSATCKNPYGSGGAGARIADTLGNIELNRRLVQKRMTY